MRLRRDTSGSAQAVTVLDDKLVVGGHFYEVADAGGDRCGAGRPWDVDQNGDPTLDPNWDPAYSGSYSLVWELHVEGAQAAHRRRVQEGQRGATEHIRAALAGFALGGSMVRRENFAGEGLLSWLREGHGEPRPSPGLCPEGPTETLGGSYSPTAERLMLRTSPALFYEVRKDIPDTTHSL